MIENPAQPGFGYSVVALPSFESNGAYFYDAKGIARWALGQATISFPTMTMSQRPDGFCPLCAHRAPVAKDIGTLTRNYSTFSTAAYAIDLELEPPLAGSWTVELPATRISDPLVCP